MATKRKSLKDNPMVVGNGIPDTLFGKPATGVAAPAPEKAAAVEEKDEKQVKLTRFEDIRAFYASTKGTKQVKVYMPAEIQSAIKAKAAQQGQSMTEFVLHLILEHALTDREIKDAYDKAMNAK
ncbi:MULTISPECIES: hypothetical protein [Lacticaseibacillus]|uniref:hypothetical protein n=1 Tax=Lacticaseibacillus TaxID=2759736 RepID=UPI0006D13188|nr:MULTISPECIES: hypothetical protein [Lacticaseibacillus]